MSKLPSKVRAKKKVSKKKARKKTRKRVEDPYYLVLPYNGETDCGESLERRPLDGRDIEKDMFFDGGTASLHNTLEDARSSIMKDDPDHGWEFFICRVSAIDHIRVVNPEEPKPFKVEEWVKGTM